MFMESYQVDLLTQHFVNYSLINLIEIFQASNIFVTFNNEKFRAG